MGKIHGRRPVVGGRDDIFLNVDKYHINQILLAIPTATPHQKRDILNICKETGCELKQLPGVYQLVNGEVSLSKMKKVAVEDLLGRDTIKVNMSEIFQYLKGKRILVTGGGGSIGSELCRQIAGHEPELLVIFDIYENNAYDIEQELKASYPNLNLKVLIGSVRDSKRINWVFETYKPEIVYHAAAHKHVPLMENSPCEAIKNNVVGTYKTAVCGNDERLPAICADQYRQGRKPDQHHGRKQTTLRNGSPEHEHGQPQRTHRLAATTWRTQKRIPWMHFTTTKVRHM